MTTNYPASANQLSFVRSLVAERSDVTGVTDLDAFMATITDERLTKTGASALIDRLLKMAKNAPVVVPGQPVRNGEPVNRRAGTCALCGHEVAAGEGTYRRNGGGWDTLHLPGGCNATAPAAADVETPNAHSWASVTALLQVRTPGRFAVPSVTGNNDLTFFAIKVNQGRMNPANKGKHYFEHIVGGHDDLRVSPEFIVKCLAALDTVGTEAAGLAYANEIGCCWKCGRELTDETSRRRGTGPECASKF